MAAAVAPVVNPNLFPPGTGVDVVIGLSPEVPQVRRAGAVNPPRNKFFHPDAGADQKQGVLGGRADVPSAKEPSAVQYSFARDFPKGMVLSDLSKGILTSNYFGAPIEGKPADSRTTNDLQRFLDGIRATIRPHDNAGLFGGAFSNYLCRGRVLDVDLHVDDCVFNLTTAESPYGREQWGSFIVVEQDVLDWDARRAEFATRSFEIIKRFTKEGTSWHTIARTLPVENGQRILSEWRMHLPTITYSNIKAIVDSMLNVNGTDEFAVMGAEDPSEKHSAIVECWNDVSMSTHAHLFPVQSCAIDALTVSVAQNLCWAHWRQSERAAHILLLSPVAAKTAMYNHWLEYHEDWAKDGLAKKEKAKPTALASSAAFAGKCFKCGKSGHRAIDCTEKKKGGPKGGGMKKNGRSNATVQVAAGQCKRCGSKAHAAYDCFARLENVNVPKKFLDQNLPMTQSAKAALEKLRGSSTAGRSNVSKGGGGVSSPCTFKGCKGKRSNHTTADCEYRSANVMAKAMTSQMNIIKAQKRSRHRSRSPSVSSSDSESESESTRRRTVRRTVSKVSQGRSRPVKSRRR